MDNNINIDKIGYVMFLPHAVGSKSESKMPYLVCSKSEIYELHKNGDNPFSNDLLKEYNLKYCSVSGKFQKNDKYILIDSIEVLKGLEGSLDEK